MTAPSPTRARGSVAARGVMLCVALVFWGLALSRARAAELAIPGQVRIDYAPRHEARARLLLTLYPRRVSALRARLGLRLSGELRIVLVRGEADMERALRARGLPAAPLEIAGLCYPFMRLVFIDLARAPNDAQLDNTATHEICHALLAEAESPDRRLPLWLNEGICQWASQQPVFGSRADIITAAGSGELLALEDISARFPVDLGRRRVAYATGEDFTRYVEGRGGPGTVREIIARFRGGASVDAAVNAVVGAPLAELYADWREKITPPGPPLFNFLAMNAWQTVSIIMLALFAMAVVIQRLRSARIRREMEAEEQTDHTPWGSW